VEPGELPVPGDLVAGKYRLSAEIGRGGMGAVFRARHEILHQNVAIKFLLPELACDQVFATRFLNEARAAALIRGEHVATVLDADLDAHGVPFMVLEHLEGRTLEDEILARGVLPVDEVAKAVIEALDALAQAHGLGIVHRDVKPGNLFLTMRPDGSRSVKLLDFGVSKLREIVAPQSAEGLTSPNSLLGSPLYMSPEQIHDAASVDARADIWSIGVILYRAATGQMPFRSKTTTGALVAILNSEPAPMEGPVPEAFERVVRRCLEKDAALRYRDVAELAEALAPFSPASAPLVRRIGGTVQSAPQGASSNTMASPSIGPPGPEVVDSEIRKKPSFGTLAHAPTARGDVSTRLTLVAAVVVALAALVLAALGLAWLSS
jgi:serine/threonine-protein kinase